MISIVLDEDVVRVGDEVRGTASWAGQARPPKSATASLRWYTEGRGNQDRDEVATSEQRLDGPSAGMNSMSFRFRVPLDAPVNYDGLMIRLRWEVNVELDVPWGRNEDEQAELWVLPR